MDLPTPPRRWFRFSLRTMFVAVTVVALWLAYSLDWIRQRHAFAAQKASELTLWYSEFPSPPRAPGFLWLLGERGVRWLDVTNAKVESQKRAQLLFPEAELVSRI